MYQMAANSTSFFTFWDYAVMVGYILGIAAVGFYVTVKSKEKSTKDYLLAGKGIPWWAISISMMVTLFSAISFLAVPEEAYKNGMRLWLSGLISLPIIPVAFWMFLGFYYRLSSFTPYSYIERRFGSSVRAMASILFLIQRGLYLAVVVYVSARAFKAAVGWDVYFTILFVGIIGTLYTAMGGMRAVVWTDVLQFFVLAGSVFFVACFVCWKVDGGFFEIFSYSFSHGRGFNLDSSFISINPRERVTLWWMILGALGVTLNTYATDQLMIQRLLSTKDYRAAKKATLCNIPLSMLTGLLFWFIGLGLFTYYNTNGASMLSKLPTDTQVFPFFVASELPVPIPGLIMAGLLAAIMSTIDSGINSLATVCCKDIYKRFINQAANEKDELNVAHKMTFFWGAFMICGALVFVMISESASSTIMETSALWSSMGGVILAIYILAVTTENIGARGIWVSAILGIVTLSVCVTKMHYMTPKDMRVSFLLVGNSGTLVTLFVGIIIVIINRIRKCNIDPEKTTGLTLWTINRSELKKRDQ
jgi:SSS family transporter